MFVKQINKVKRIFVEFSLKICLKNHFYFSVILATNSGANFLEKSFQWLIPYLSPEIPEYNISLKISNQQPN